MEDELTLGRLETLLRERGVVRLALSQKGGEWAAFAWRGEATSVPAYEVRGTMEAAIMAAIESIAKERAA